MNITESIILTAVGLMSGTSMDGIDGVIMQTDGQSQIQQLCTESLDYDMEYKILLRSAEYAVRKAQGDMDLAQKNYWQYLHDYLEEKYEKTEQSKSEDNIRNTDDGIEELSSKLANYLVESDVNIKSNIQMRDIDIKKILNLQNIIDHSTYLHAKLVEKLLDKSNKRSFEIDLIGYHGQTLYHSPTNRITIQAGNGQLLANATNITVINDFRTNDVLNGGQGAPLAPVYHQALSIRDKNYPLAVLNCGGIANITIITGEEPGNLIGYDTGPGNVLIDCYIREYTGSREFMDTDGKYGKAGKVDEEMLKLLYQKSIQQDSRNYLETLPPKSLDTSDCNLIEEIHNLKFEDACTTLEAFTAFTIIDSLKFLDAVNTENEPKTWLLAGGGWNNPVITDKLKEYLQKNSKPEIEILSANEIGWDSKYMEAEIFAYLAVRSLHKLPISYPQTTKVNSPNFGGHAYVSKVGKITNNVALLLKKNPKILSGYEI